MNQPIPWTKADIDKALGVDSGKAGQEHIFTGVSTDSRTIEPGELFVALEGELFDGHAFISGLMERGIRGFVVKKDFMAKKDKKNWPDAPHDPDEFDVLFFPVDNTLTALGDLARFQRLRAGVKVVAITGSNGKTSTRTMTSAIFGKKFNILATHGNFNNEIGLPLTLLKLSQDHQWAVVEMGMSHSGEIDRLARIALPDIGLVTNTCDCHLEGLGTVERVAMAKAELLTNIGPDGTAVLNLDDPRFSTLMAAAEANANIKQTMCFTTCDRRGDCVRAESLEGRAGGIRFRLVCPSGESSNVFIHTPALFMVNNALAAAAAALGAGISLETIKKGLENFKPVSGRMHLVEGFGNTTIIDDSYNANPGSVRAALETLKKIAGPAQSIAILGDMLELGQGAELFHREIGGLAAQLGISKLYLHGSMACHVLEGAIAAGFPGSATFMGTRQEIACLVMKHTPENSWILVKGSRGMKLESIVKQLKQSATTFKGPAMGSTPCQELEDAVSLSIPAPYRDFVF